MELLLLDCWTLQEYHLWRSLNLFKNSPIDVQGFSTVSCSFVPFHCSTGQKSLFIKWVPRVVWTTLLVFLLHTLSSCPPMIDFGSSMGSGYLRTCSFMRWRPSYPTLDVARIICGDHWNLSGILQLMFKASPKSRALSCLSNAPRGKQVFSSSEPPG